MAYTNSPLISITSISPYQSGQRNHAIDRITPHCVVGQTSAKWLANFFQTSGTSCNYGIGTEGGVALICEESCRSWCSSSPDNDNRAVTIECASDAVAPYTFNNTVYAKLIELCVDICKRNGKTKLLWLGTKNTALSYQPKADEMILTAHRWFAQKGCPGDWLYDRLGDLASQVTKRLGGVVTPVPVVPVTQPTPSTSFSTSNNEKAIWTYLRDKGLNEFAVAGVMGNLYAESGLCPGNLQNSYEKLLGYTDMTYTQAVDSGRYKKFVNDGAGYGLAQWTYYTRKQALLRYAQSIGQSIGSLTAQLDYLWQELQGYTIVMNILKTATSISMASDAILTGFEKPADQSEHVKAKRASFGQVYYDRYAGSKPTVIKLYRVRKAWNDNISQKGAFTDIDNAKKCADANPGYFVYDNSGKVIYSGAQTAVSTSYQIRVTADVLMIRKGAGTNYPTVGKIADRGVYTIVEESTGAGATKWGKLKSGAGWISLDYTEKVK